ncbi:MAG: NAD-dependent epimerase/dehydratase family protein, partial [Sciscionella sp.]
MRVLVTGATGFLGRSVAASLCAHGHEVVAFVRRPVDTPVGIETVTGDVRDPAAVARAVAGVDGVCHLAAVTRVRDSFTDPARCWRTNVVGTLNVLDALSANGKGGRLVLASTAAVYGVTDRQPINEDAETVPTSPYGRTKLAADEAAADVARSGAIGAVSLRAFNIAGASAGTADPDRTRLIPKVLAVQAGLAAELTINGDGSAVRDFVHVADMAEAFALALDACKPGVWSAYNVGSGRRASVAEVVRIAEKVTGRSVPVRHLAPADEPAMLLADSSRIRRELDWLPRNSDLK